MEIQSPLVVHEVLEKLTVLCQQHFRMLWCIGLGVAQECLLQHSGSFVKNANVFPQITTSDIKPVGSPQRLPQGCNEKAHSLFGCEGVMLHTGSLDDFVRVFDSLPQPQGRTQFDTYGQGYPPNKKGQPGSIDPDCPSEQRRGVLLLAAGLGAGLLALTAGLALATGLALGGSLGTGTGRTTATTGH